jgi:hypothetical protein
MLWTLNDGGDNLAVVRQEGKEPSAQGAATPSANCYHCTRGLVLTWYVYVIVTGIGRGEKGGYFTCGSLFYFQTVWIGYIDCVERLTSRPERLSTCSLEGPITILNHDLAVG